MHFHASRDLQARFLAAPAPIVLHIVSASLFCVVGALQFVAEFRRRKPQWHRVAGRFLTTFGLGSGMSGLWMNLFYDLPATDGALLYFFRLLFGVAMVICLGLGFVAIRNRNVRQHSAWMTRGYAIGLGAGTQALVQVPFSLDGPPGVLSRGMLMGAGWAHQPRSRRMDHSHAVAGSVAARSTWRSHVKAAVYDRYGPPYVVQIRDLPKPTPRPGEILIHVRAATVAAGDWRLRRPSPFLARLFNGLFRPKKVHVLGFELSGDVEAVGTGVSRFKTGDSVFAFTGFGFGAHAEYRCLQESGQKPQWDGIVAHKPANLGHEEAAAVPVGALTAQYFLKKSELKQGQSVLIYGASGSVGTYAIQLAKALGAEVTGVCSTANLELVRGLGADHIIDYSKEEMAASGRVYDVVFDAVGKLPSSSSRSLVAKGGKRESVRGSAKLEPGDLAMLKDLIEAGKVRPVIDRRFPLEEIVRAHEYVEAGHKKGNVVITMPTAS